VVFFVASANAKNAKKNLKKDKKISKNPEKYGKSAKIPLNCKN
jgi:hypothetical protein